MNLSFDVGDKVKIINQQTNNGRVGVVVPDTKDGLTSYRVHLPETEVWMMQGHKQVGRVENDEVTIRVFVLDLERILV